VLPGLRVGLNQPVQHHLGFVHRAVGLREADHSHLRVRGHGAVQRRIELALQAFGTGTRAERSDIHHEQRGDDSLIRR